MDSTVNHNYKNQGIKFFKEWVIPIAVALIIAMLIKNFLFFNIYVPSESMVPTINKEDRWLLQEYIIWGILKGEILLYSILMN